MKRDNFDLRGFLVENKLTENSRGEKGRYRFDGSQNNTGRARILSEMRIPVSKEESYSGESNQDKVAIVLSYTTEIRPSLRVAGHTLDLSDYEGWDEMDPTKGILIDGTPLSEYTDNKALQQIVSGIMSLPDFESVSFKQDYPNGIDEKRDPLDAGLDECGDFGPDGNFGLKEAGYDLGDDEDDGLGNIPDLADIIGNDPAAKRAAKAAQRDIDRDVKASEKDDAAAAAADAPAGPADSADDPGAVPDVPVTEPAAADYEPGISSRLEYNPELIQFEMTPEELDQYLSSFRRPEAALRYINQKLKVFQQEVNDGTRQKAYMYLRNGDSSYQWSYTRPSPEMGELIATINKDPNYQGWED